MGALKIPVAATASSICRGTVADRRLLAPVRAMLLEAREQLVALNTRLAACDRLYGVNYSGRLRGNFSWC
jgi:hypothetical protein